MNQPHEPQPGKARHDQPQAVEDRRNGTPPEEVTDVVSDSTDVSADRNARPLGWFDRHVRLPWVVWSTRKGIENSRPRGFSRSVGREANLAAVAEPMQPDDPGSHAAQIEEASRERALYWELEAITDAIPVAKEYELASETESDAHEARQNMRQALREPKEEVDRLEDRVDQLERELPEDPEPQLPTAEEQEEELEEAAPSYRGSALITGIMVLLAIGIDGGTTVPLMQDLSVGLPGIGQTANRAIPLIMGCALAAAIPLLGHFFGRLEYRASGEREEPAWMRLSPGLLLFGPLVAVAVARGVQLATGPHGGIGPALVGFALGLLMLAVADVAVRHGYRSADGKAVEAKRPVREHQRQQVHSARQPTPTPQRRQLVRAERKLGEARRDVADLEKATGQYGSIAQTARDERVQAAVELRGRSEISRLQTARERSSGSRLVAWFGARRDGISARRLGSRPVKYADSPAEVWKFDLGFEHFEPGSLASHWRTEEGSDGASSGSNGRRPS